MSDDIPTPHEAHEQAENAHGHARLDRFTLFTVCLIAVLSGVFAMVDEEKEVSTSNYLSTQMNIIDNWSQYQAKSVRAEINGVELSLLSSLKDSIPELKNNPKVDKRIESVQKRIEHLNSDETSFGKEQIAEKAKEEELHKDHSLHKMHGYGTSTKGLHIAIILASVGLVVRKRWVPIVSSVIGGSSTLWAVLVLLNLI